MKINLGILVYFTDTKLNLLLCWLELFSKPINNESLGKVWISKKNHQHRTQSEPQPNTISIHNYLFVTMGYFSEAVISESCVLFVSLAPTFCVYYFIKVFCLFNEWVQSPQSLVWFFCTVSKIFVISEENWQLYLCRCWSLLVFFLFKKPAGFCILVVRLLHDMCIFKWNTLFEQDGSSGSSSLRIKIMMCVKFQIGL